MRNNEITMKLLITDILAVATKRKSEMTSYLNNGYDVMNYFAKFEKFIPHRIIMPSFMTVGSQMPELDLGAFLPPPSFKIGSQNTPYKLGLNGIITVEVADCNSTELPFLKSCFVTFLMQFKLQDNQFH